MIDRCYIEITNTCNLNCHFCPKHNRAKRQLTAEEFDLLTSKLKGKACFLYFHLMGEPLLHPLLPQFITLARERGFKTVLTSNGTLLHRAMELLDTLPHKIQLSVHSHESNAQGRLSDYMDEVMRFSTQAAAKGTCMVLRLWNQGGMDQENEEVMSLIENKEEGQETGNSEEDKSNVKGREVFCKALIKQIGVLADGSLVPCCLDHNGDVVLGNLFHQSLEDILSSPRATALIEGFKHHHASEALCRDCESALARNSFRGKARKQI